MAKPQLSDAFLPYLSKIIGETSNDTLSLRLIKTQLEQAFLSYEVFKERTGLSQQNWKDYRYWYANYDFDYQTNQLRKRLLDYRAKQLNFA